MSAAEAIALVETERTQAVERRAEWRAGFESGLKQGAGRAFQLRVVEDIALELVLLRMTVDVLAKREAWFQAKLRDAYHVIGNPRREVPR